MGWYLIQPTVLSTFSLLLFVVFGSSPFRGPSGVCVSFCQPCLFHFIAARAHMRRHPPVIESAPIKKKTLTDSYANPTSLPHVARFLSLSLSGARARVCMFVHVRQAVHMSVYDGVKETAPSVKEIPPLLSGFFEREISARLAGRTRGRRAGGSFWGLCH